MGQTTGRLGKDVPAEVLFKSRMRSQKTTHGLIPVSYQELMPFSRIQDQTNMESTTWNNLEELLSRIDIDSDDEAITTAALHELSALLAAESETRNQVQMFIRECQRTVDEAIANRSPSSAMGRARYLKAFADFGFVPEIERISIYCSVANLHLDAGDYISAEDCLACAHSGMANRRVPRELRAQAYGLLTMLYLESERFAAARQAARTGLTLLRQARAPLQLRANFYGLLGRISEKNHEYREAERHIKRGISLLESIRPEDRSPNDELNLGSGYGALASSLMHLGRYEEAELAAVRGLELERTSGASPLDIAESLSSLSSLLKARGKLGQAEECSARAVRLFRSHHEHPIQLAVAVADHANLLAQRKRLRPALRFAQEVRTILAEFQDPSRETAWLLLHVGGVLAAARRQPDGAAVVREAIGQLRRLNAPAFELAQAYMSLGSILDELGNKIDALNAFESAASFYAEAGVNSMLLPKTIYWVAKLSADSGEALERWESACKAALRCCLLPDDAEDQIDLSRNVQFVFREAAKWAMSVGQLESALEWSEFGRGFALTTSLSRHLSSESFPDQSDLDSEQAALEVALERSPQSNRRAISRRLAIVNDQLSKNVAAQEARMNELVGVTGRESTFGALPSGSVYIAVDADRDDLLVTVVSNRVRNIFVCSPPRHLWWHEAGGWFVKRLEDVPIGEKRPQAMLDRIRDIVFPPDVQFLISAAEHLIFSLGGGLNAIPFEAMNIEGRRLDTRCKVSRSWGVRSLGLGTQVARTNQRAGVLSVGIDKASGNSRLTNDTQCPNGRRSGLVPLTWAKREAASVAALYAQDGASPSSPRRKDILTRLPQCGLLHASVHGEANLEDPLESCLRFLPLNGRSGRLTAREIFDLDLSEMTLAVLSACSSLGSDHHTGVDGPLGLPFAFVRAGARCVVATIRPVDDRLGHDMMLRMHARLRQGASVHDALAAAKFAARAGEFGAFGADIREASSFVIFGDPNTTLPPSLIT
jgi:tetratricopeptide (TPR) repeat protein